MNQPGNKASQLVRSLTLVPATALILTAIIGTGVFVKSRVIICNVETPGMLMLVWIAAGLLALAGALTFAELASMMPRSGGMFHYLKKAYGQRMAFLYGWTDTLAMGAGCAAVSIVCVVFLNDLLGGRMPAWLLRVLPAGLLLLATGLNLRSVKSSGRIVTLFTVVKVSILVGIGVGAVLLGDGAWANYTATAAEGLGEGVPESARGGLGGFGAAMLGALWSYEGWVVITNVGGEVRNPARTLPRALIGGTILVIGLYLLVNLGYFYVLTPLEVANLPASTSIAREAISRTAGPVAVSVLACGLVISAFGTLYSSLFAGPRLPFAMARKQLLPAALGTLSVHAVPAVSIITIGLWSTFLSLTGTFDILTDICVFVGLIFYGLTGGAVFVLRKTMPDAERPYRTWGYPVVPALFVLVSIALLLNTVMVTPWRAFFGFGIVASGLPVYAYYSRRKVASVPATRPALIRAPV